MPIYMYVCLLMVGLVSHLMITPPPEGPHSTHPFVPHLLTLVAIWHGQRVGYFGVVGALWQIIGLIGPATCQLRISKHLTWSPARCAEGGQRCFYAPLKRSHPWEEHGSHLADGINGIVCYKCISGLSWEMGKYSVVFGKLSSVPPYCPWGKTDFLRYRDVKSIWFSVIGTRVGRCLKLECS